MLWFTQSKALLKSTYKALTESPLSSADCHSAHWHRCKCVLLVEVLLVEGKRIPSYIPASGVVCYTL